MGSPPDRRTILLRALGLGASAALPAGLALAQTPPLQVGILKFASHAALDADELGFTEALQSAGFSEGTHIRIDRRNAQGNSQTALEIAREFVSLGVDLIYSIATPASIAAVQATRRVPVVFSSVTDPVAAKLVPQGSRAGQTTGTNVTGVSDAWPVGLQLETYADMVPGARRWGTIYNPGEINSVVHIGQMRAAAQRLGLELIEVLIQHSSEVPQAAESLVGRVDAINITSDNTTVANLEALVQVCQTHRIPLFAGDTDSVDRGALAAFGMDYFLVGYAAGRKAALVLRGIAPGDIPWGPVEKFSLVINLPAAASMGVDVAEAMVRKADRLIR